MIAIEPSSPHCVLCWSLHRQGERAIWHRWVSQSKGDSLDPNVAFFLLARCSSSCSFTSVSNAGTPAFATTLTPIWQRDALTVTGQLSRRSSGAFLVASLWPCPQLSSATLAMSSLRERFLTWVFLNLLPRFGLPEIDPSAAPCCMSNPIPPHYQRTESRHFLGAREKMSLLLSAFSSGLVGAPTGVSSSVVL